MFTIKAKAILYGKELQVKNANIIIENSKISKITNSKETKGRVIEADLCMPGLINAHTHIADFFLFGKIQERDVEALFGINGIKQRMLAKAKDEEIISGMKKALCLMQKTGTTTFCDFREGGLDGIRLLKYALSDFKINPIILGRPKEMKFDKNEILNLLTESDGLGLRSPNDWSDIELNKFRKITKNKLLATHVSETKEMVAESIQKYGQEDTERCEKSRFDFCVHSIYSKKSTNLPIVVCPRSNFKTKIGMPKIREYIQKKVVCLGTDNFMLNEPNLFLDMQFVLENYPISAKEVVKMCTSNAIDLFKIKRGAILEGNYADFVLFNDIDLDNLYEYIIYNENNICDVIINGESIYE